MKIGGTYSITFEFDNNSFNYFTLGLSSPYLYAKSATYDYYAEDQRSIGIRANTCATFDKSGHSWSVRLLVLGFGIELIRQWSY